jgi:hypothetical protein
MTNMALRMRELLGRCVDVAIDNDVLSVGDTTGLTSTWLAHSVDLTAFSGSTA